MNLLLVLLLLPYVTIQSYQTPPPPPHILMAQRFLSNLHHLPNVIKSQMEGKPDELKKMVSHVLGDGLISKIVSDPIEAAKSFGFDSALFAGLPQQIATATPSLAIDQPANLQSTDEVRTLWSSEKMLKEKKKVQWSPSHPIITTTMAPSSTPSPTTMTTTTTTTTTMTTTTAMPSTSTTTDDQQLTEKIMIALRRALNKEEAPSPSNDPPHRSSSRTHHRRRWSPSNNIDDSSSSSLSSMSIDEVHTMQRYLQSYEETLQKRELLQQRLKLQQLQQRLQQQKLKMQEEQIRDEQMRLHEQQLKAMRDIKMQQQIAQHMTNNWQGSSTIDDDPSISNLPFSIDNEPLSTIRQHPPSTTIDESDAFDLNLPPILSNIFSVLPTGDNVTTITDDEPVLQPKNPFGDQQLSELEATSSVCECMEIDMSMMSGEWIHALADTGLLSSINNAVDRLLLRHQSPASIRLDCTKIDISNVKQSIAAQDAQLLWTFRTTNNSRANSRSQEYEVMGNMLTTDHRTINVQIHDRDGNRHKLPLCILKTGSNVDGSRYEYMVMVRVDDGIDGCRSAGVLVRDPNHFFNDSNQELVVFLKHLIANDQLRPLKLTPHANNCDN